jgi:hypothetical protein
MGMAYRGRTHGFVLILMVKVTHFAGPFQDVLNQGSRKGLGYHS